MHERIRDILLAVWGRTVATHPVITLIVCIAIAGASVYVTATGLEFRSDRSQLVDPDEPWNKLYSEYKKNFPHYQDVTVVLDGPSGTTDVDELAKTIADRLAGDERIATADAGFDIATAGPRFFRTAGPDRFEEALGGLAAARGITAAENANAGLGLLLNQVREGRGDPGAIDRLEQFLVPYLAAARGETRGFEFMRPEQSRWQPLVSSEGTGRLRYVRLHLADANQSVNRLAATLAWVRESVGLIVAGSTTPDVEWGVTGLPAIEADETTEAINDSTIASLMAIGLITLVMFVAFRGLTVPLLAAGALLIGMAWSFGWLMVSVGHLQLLSVVFSVILLGLGIDFALLFVSRLELIQDEHEDLASATARVYRRMGPGMVTGAVTTAAAFAATALTNFKGMAEMGVIAAGGILLCLIAVLSAFPALLALTGRWKQIIRHRPGGEQAHFAHGRLDFVDGHPVGTLTAAGIMAAVLVALALTVEYDPNVLNLQSDNVESVQWEKRIVRDDARSVWSAVVLCPPVQAPQLVRRLREAPGVSGVGGMGILFSDDMAEREQRIAAVRDLPVAVLPANPGLASMITQLASVHTGIMMNADTAPPDIRTRLQAIAADIDEAIKAARGLDGRQQEQSWEQLNAAFVTARDDLAGWLEAALAPGPPDAEDLPPFLRDMWVGRDGAWLLTVQPEADPLGRSVLDPDRLGTFVASARAAVAGTGIPVIGAPVQIYESSELIQREYIKAACYAVAAILVLLFLDFRRLADALCAMAPVTVGFVGAFGMMGLTGVPLNFANIIVLPIIFGIGVNAGVHVVHRWRLEPFGRPRGLSGGTGRGITLTMLTTMIGFGCLLTAGHRGIRSLGFVMVIGLFVTLLACYTMLPAMLKLRARAAAVAAREERGRQSAATPVRHRRRSEKKLVARR